MTECERCTDLEQGKAQALERVAQLEGDLARVLEHGSVGDGQPPMSREREEQIRSLIDYAVERFAT